MPGRRCNQGESFARIELRDPARTRRTAVVHSRGITNAPYASDGGRLVMGVWNGVVAGPLSYATNMLTTHGILKSAGVTIGAGLHPALYTIYPLKSVW